MKFFRALFLICFAFMPVASRAGIFSDIYENMERISWGGKDMGDAIVGLEKLNPDIHIAATKSRVILVWKDNIIGNWVRPNNADEFDNVISAMVFALRDNITVSDADAANALLFGIDENARYIDSDKSDIADDNKILTSVGIEGARDERGNFRVKGIIMGSSADDAGIKDGNIIIEINGRAIVEITDGEIASEFSGFNSGTMKLTVLDEAGVRNITLRRASIVLADADIIVRKPILEIVVHKVSDRAAAIVAEALHNYQDGISGIILDLRTSSGADARAVAKIAGLFMGRTPVLRIAEFDAQEVEVIPGGDAMTLLPIAVLVSGDTTGMGEALAAAFYENSRGVLVGVPTAGNVALATQIDLKSGGRIELFNRNVKTGGGIELSGRGIFPAVCLSNIRSNSEMEVFFVNLLNGDFGAKDFNQMFDVDAAALRKSCPEIKSGAQEDAVSAGVAAQILTDASAYKVLLGK